MRWSLFVLFCLPVFSFAGDNVYKWKDSSGAVHFTDQPRKGCKES